MRITFFNLPHLSYNRGGEKWIKEVASYLSNRHKVTVITTDFMKFSDLTNFNFNYITIKFRKKMIFLNDISEIRDYLKDTDVVYAFYTWAGTQREIVRHANKVIFGHHSLIGSLLQKVYYTVLEIDKKIKCSYHHFLTQYRADMYNKKGFNKIFVIPNFIDTKKYTPGIKPEDKFIIISPGVTTKEKGVDILLNIAEVLKGFKDIEFYVAGHKYKEINFQENIKYLGFLLGKNYIDVIRNAHLMLLPTRSEAFSFSVLENLAVGNPIVISNIPDVMSAFGSSEAIYYAKTGDTKDYLNAVLKYYKLWKNNREKYLEISNKARELALKFDSEIILPKIEEMFRLVYMS